MCVCVCIFIGKIFCILSAAVWYTYANLLELRENFYAILPFWSNWVLSSRENLNDKQGEKD